MVIARRALLLAGLTAGAAGAAGPTRAADDDAIRHGRVLVFPRDHGAHLGARTEWWYATGWLGSPQAPRWGLQLTFFRSRTGLADGLASRFAARQLLFAHAALTDLDARRHRHDQRIVRWNGGADDPAARADATDTRVAIGRWRFEREAASGRYHGHIAAQPAAGFELDLDLHPTQPLLLQGDAGYSRKGPREEQASHYYSQPQLQLRARLQLDGRRVEAEGRAWLDHEWSDELLDPEAVGWDWLGINLFDGSALTAFRLRRADGSVLWAGGSLRSPGAAARSLAADEVQLEPGRRWRSPATGASYPMQWQVRVPGATYELRALLDAQELDSRASTGSVYWEGLSELLDAGGRRVGLGYLEMTGYTSRLRLE